MNGQARKVYRPFPLRGWGHGSKKSYLNHKEQTPYGPNEVDSCGHPFNVSPKSEEEREMEMKAGPDFSPRMSTDRENWFPLSLNCTFNGQHNERSVSHLPTFNPWFSPVFCTCAQFEV